jgi:hypothetical protein
VVGAPEIAVQLDVTALVGQSSHCTATVAELGAQDP